MLFYWHESSVFAWQRYVFDTANENFGEDFTRFIGHVFGANGHFVWIWNIGEPLHIGLPRVELMKELVYRVFQKCPCKNLGDQVH
jgi:hypothetical protein